MIGERGRGHERGQVTFFGIGMLVVLLFVTGLSLDLWRAFSERRALFEMADAAASAGANGIDTNRYRTSGDLVLDPILAEQIAWSSLQSQTDDRALVDIPTVAASADGITVVLRGEVPMTLLGIFMVGEPFEILVRAEAVPRASGG